MQDILFNDILNELKDIHQKYPDLRFGQVIQESMDLSKKLNNVNFFDKSSKQVLASLVEFNNNTDIKRKAKGEK